MSRSRFPKPRVRVTLEEGETLTLAHLRHAGVRIDDLLLRTGLAPRNLEQFLGGRRPAGWIQREISAAIGVEVHRLWPADPDGLHRGSFDDHRARGAAQRNLGRGVSRGGRHTNEEF